MADSVPRVLDALSRGGPSTALQRRRMQPIRSDKVQRVVRLRLPHSLSIVLAIVGLADIPAHATSSASYQPGMAAVASQASTKSQAIVELRRAAASLRRTADELVAAPGALIPNLRGFSVGARRTNKAYGGREGLHQLPGAKGGMNGGFIGFRRAAETSGKKSPAIDLNTPELGYVKFHLVR